MLDFLWKNILRTIKLTPPALAAFAGAIMTLAFFNTSMASGVHDIFDPGMKTSPTSICRQMKEKDKKMWHNKIALNHAPDTIWVLRGRRRRTTTRST